MSQQNKRGGKLVIPGYIQRKGALNQAEATEKWKKIEHAIHQIYQQNASNLSFQVLYTSGYQIVLHKFGELLYNGVEKTLQEYIVGMRDKIMQVSDEAFLQELLNNWEKHRTSVGMVRDILMYMDRNYVPQNKKTPVYELGIKIFGNEVFFKDKKVLDRIQRLIMGIIRRERNGETVPDRFLLKNLVGMLLEISKKDAYIPCFERKFIEESKDFFAAEASYFFEKTTAPDYLRKVVQRLREERDRADRCLEEETKPKVEKVIKDEMIAAYKQRLIEKEGTGCASMLREWRVDDLRLVFDVLSLVEGALQPCVDLVRTYCTEQGMDIVREQVAGAAAPAPTPAKPAASSSAAPAEGEEEKDDPVSTIQQLIELREKYEDLLSKAFSNRKGEEIIRDKEFATAVRRAFDDICNHNQRFSEYLSLYCDSKLKKGKTQISETEFDALFDQVITLFRHLRDKDVFEKYYKNHLAKRLLADRSQSDEAEKSFIAKLKTEFGYQFTSKLEGMFTDMKISKENMEHFKNYLDMNAVKPPVDIYVQVLTTGFWPAAPTTQCSLPQIIGVSSDIFSKYYLTTHSGRKLTYQYNMGTADIRSNGFAKKFELNVSTYQMCILLLFNEAETLTYQEIQNLTRIPLVDLKRNLLALTVKNKTHEKVLIKDGEKTLDNDSKFTANSEFDSKLIKVKICPVVLKETKQQVQATQQKVDEERKWQLDAVVVRVMKTRKTLEHRQLVLEVTKQLQQRFMPSPELIKKRIESLIEREYLERDKNDRSKYNYLA